MTAAPTAPTTRSALAATTGIVPALPGFTAAEIAAALDACREITRLQARNFYYGLRLTPEPRRSSLYAIYAWMRTADDAVDEPATARERLQRLAEVRARTHRILAADFSELASLPPMWLGFAAVIHSYPVEHALFHDTLEGLEADIAGVELATEDDLTRYCYCVAGTVGLACVSIWGLRAGADARVARDLALRRGQAFQRTNILRDFAQDFDQSPRRIYLPRQQLESAGLTAQSLRDWTEPEACAAFILRQARTAREHYAASQPLESLIEPDCAPTLWAMTRIYSGILEQIERDPSRVVEQGGRARVPAVRKASIAITASLRARLQRW